MLVNHAMTRPAIVTRPDATVAETAALMRDRNVGFLPVVARGAVLGIVTDRDIAIRAAAAALDPRATLTGAVMTRDCVACCDDDDVREAMRRMRCNCVRRLPVVDGSQRLVGVIALRDLARVCDDAEVATTLCDCYARPTPAPAP
jgi:CBS domain-containing protein